MLKLIIEPVKEDGNLLDMDHIKSLCAIESRLTSHHHVDKSCGMVSLLDVFRKVTGATCGTINAAHITVMNSAISSCMAHYISGVTIGQPAVCQTVFDLFFYFSDSVFSSGSNNIGNIYPLRRTLMMILLQDLPESEAASDYHADMLDKRSLSFDGVTQITGIDSAVKGEVFKRYLFFDLTWMVLAFILVSLVVTIYLKSFVMAVVTAANIGLSLTIAYFFYLIVFRITFFPFLNLLSSVILIALAADDVFLFSETWDIMKKRFPRGSLEDNMTLTFHHAGLSVFVTSITTATSFFSNYVSDVTCIKCFGVYAGLCIIANYVLMCTFIPSVMMLMEKSCCNPCAKLETPACFTRFYERVCAASEFVFGRAFFFLINKFYPLLLVIFIAIAAGSAVVVYYKPKLLPHNGRIKVFGSSHPMEVYDDLISSFKFIQKGDFSLPLFYVWGVEPLDNGNPLNPDDHGKLVLDETFNIESKYNQQWIANLCLKVKSSQFIIPNNVTVCSMDLYLKSLTKPCVTNDQKCCLNRNSDFSTCFPPFMAELYATTPVQIIAGLPYFDANNKVKAFLMNFTSIQGYVTDYDIMNNFYNNISDHLKNELKINTPSGASQVFLTSFFGFYDTQKSLSKGIFESVAISLAITLLCVLLSTRNIIVSIYSIIDIAQAIHVVVAALVLLGWTLNVTESIIISLAVGLTIDFVIHFGVAYILSYEMTREKRVHDVLTSVGSPATMAAFTTFIAGAAMLPSTVFCYQQLGIFLVLCMVISLAYSLFFFLPLCRLMGPLGNLFQIPLPFCLRDTQEDSAYSSNETSIASSYASSKSNSPEGSPRGSEKSSKHSSFTNIDSIIHGSKKNIERNMPSLNGFQDSQSYIYRDIYTIPCDLDTHKPPRTSDFYNRPSNRPSNHNNHCNDCHSNKPGSSSSGSNPSPSNDSRSNPSRSNHSHSNNIHSNPSDSNHSHSNHNHSNHSPSNHSNKDSSHSNHRGKHKDHSSHSNAKSHGRHGDKHSNARDSNRANQDIHRNHHVKPHSHKHSSHSSSHDPNFYSQDDAIYAVPVH